MKKTTTRILVTLAATTLLSGVAAFSLAGCGGAGDGAQKPIRLTYSIFFPPTHLQTQTAVRWCEEIERRSGGRVKITTYPGGSLTKPEQCWQGVLSGISDLGMSCFSYTPGRFRLLEALDLPLGWPDGLAATRIATALARKYDPEETRVAKLLLVHAHGPGILATREPVRTLDDLRNRRIRGTGLSAQIIAKLGATPVGMPQSDTYDALQKGVAEGTFCPVETLKGWRQAETIRFVTDSSEPIGYTTAMFVAMNLNTWNKLPPDIQQIFLDVTDEFIDEHGRAWNQADQDGWELVRSLGREVIPLSDAEKTRWKQAAAPILEDYVRAAEAEGLPGRAFLEDAQRMIAEARSDADPTPDAD